MQAELPGQVSIYASEIRAWTFSARPGDAAHTGLPALDCIETLRPILQSKAIILIWNKEMQLRAGEILDLGQGNTRMQAHTWS
jgi:hypothetical protein